MRGAYDTPTRKCPYCSMSCDADWVDVGVGLVQCGPYHCGACGASEIGAYDESRVLTVEEKKTGWYRPGSEPGSSANVVGGKIVSHQVAKQVYQDNYPFSATDTGRELIRKHGVRIR